MLEKVMILLVAFCDGMKIITLMTIMFQKEIYG